MAAARRSAVPFDTSPANENKNINVKTILEIILWWKFSAEAV